MEEKLHELKEQVKKNLSQLTKRNGSYIFQLRKAMKVANYSEIEEIKILKNLLPKLLDAQKKGQTARQLFGTVANCMSTFKSKSVVAKNDKALFMWLDSTLLMLGLLSTMTTIMNFFAKNREVKGNGVITLLVMAAIGGFVFLVMYHLFYKYEKPGADLSTKPRWWVSMLILLGSMLVWMLLMSLTTILPSNLNPILSKEVMLPLAVLSLAGWRIFHKKFNVESSFVSVKKQ
ncbi:MAG: DUF1129 domain-containing protein [Streptococcaceae bacterium]|jgi:uncharacterized membrane-anchored protein|nr:DUF1129 domain-containing protein [Streptococcaceae bacterium]